MQSFAGPGGALAGGVEKSRGWAVKPSGWELRKKTAEKPPSRGRAHAGGGGSDHLRAQIM